MNRNRKICCWILLLLMMAMVPAARGESGRIQGAVWKDQTPDGMMDDEIRVEGAVIILEKKTEEGESEEIARTESDADGAYSLAVPESGTYRLRVELPPNYRFTFHGADSAVLPAQGSESFTPYFEAADGDVISLNIGTTRSKAAVTFMVYEDANGNGSRASAEKRLRNVRVGILYEYEGETYTVAETLTPTGGRITLEDLSPGTYRAYFEVPEGYRVGPMGRKFSGWHSCFTQEGNMGFTVPFTVNVRENQWVGAGVVRADE